MLENNDLIESIKSNEGFLGVVYKDTEGFDTIGIGTKLPLSYDEAVLLARFRLGLKTVELIKKEPFVKSLPLDKQHILIEMSYQMGVKGVLKFKKMFIALKSFNYELASREMLDSKWAKQTPNRAILLAKKMAIIPVKNTGFDCV